MSSSSTPIDVEIECRNIPFNFSIDDAGYWNDNSPVKTYFWNSLSLGLPQLENAAVKTIANVLPSIKDEALNKCAKVFCMQESTHAIKHGVFNSAFLQGNHQSFINLDNKIFAFVIGLLPQKFTLGLFSGVEHITSIISHVGLEQPERWFGNCNPEVYRLWDWHAMEELEHKSVCFDVYNYMGGGWLQRCITMLFVTFFILLPSVSVRLLYLLWNDKKLFLGRTWKQIFSLLVGRDGVFRLILGEYLEYFKKNFNPWDQDSRSLISAWKKKQTVGEV